MRVLLIGSGGREHAIADALLRSPKLSKLSVAPGNAGLDGYNVELDVSDHQAVIDWCTADRTDLVVVGPEAPLVAGIADALTNAGFAVFGPSANAARLEGSKEFTREFAERHGVPGPRCAAFSDVDAAIAFADELGGVAVIKADGLAAGKGVIVPSTRDETVAAITDMLDGGSMGSAGARVVVEELMVGEELSLFGIADGERVVALATAQDHKRVGEGDTGPNTGGMGAFAPVPGVDAERQAELAEIFLDRTVAGMAAEGSPYVGVVYAGLMITDDGPRLVEYNCRFGDPEAEVLLPLLETDLLEMMEAAAHGALGDVDVVVSDDTAATVIVCADGYPAGPRKGVPVVLPTTDANVRVFHAGTSRDDSGAVVSSGGRVVAVTGRGADLDAALAAAYPVVDQIVAAADGGLFARGDIGWRYAGTTSSQEQDMTDAGASGGTASAYAASGVSLDAAEATIDRIADAVKSTHTESVVAGLGSFGGVFDLAALAGMDRPLLVSSTDTTGTKPILAEATGRWEGIGADIANHGVNDVLVQGARPLFMLDTVSAAQLDPEIVGQVVDGMAAACRDAGCVLIGGETAEVPGVLVDGAVDVAGTMIGAVDRDDLLPRAGIAPGYALLGLASSGLHTNGYSLARRAVADRSLDDPVPGGDGETFADALLAVHRSYWQPLRRALDEGLVEAMAHITGGGLIDNMPRVLPDDVVAEIDTSSWPRQAIFDFLIEWADIGRDEAHQILNCGIGMVCVVAPDNVEAFTAAVDETVHVIGELRAREGDEPQVVLR